MPCRDDGAYAYTSEKLDKLTRLLCEACKLLHSHIHPHTLQARMSDELREWYEEHQELDKRREEAEKEESERKRTKEQALNKLTEGEKRALGY